MSQSSDPRQRSSHPVDSFAGPEPAEAYESDSDQVREEIRKTVASLLPWGVSIMAHVGLIVLGFFLVWQTIEQQPEPPKVTAVLAEAPPAPVNLIKDKLDEQLESSSSASFQPVVAETEPTDPTIGFNQAPIQTSMVENVTRGDRGNFCCGTGDGKERGMFQQLTAPANRIVYLIDASGSMVDVLPFVIDELRDVVGRQSVERHATVIFFSGEGVFEVPGAPGASAVGLRQLTPAYKQQIREWVTLENHRFPTGGTGSVHVRDALTRALSYQPESIVLLSDNLTGGGQGATQHELFQEDLVALIHANNRRSSPGDGPSATIDTIQFLYPDPLVEAGLQGTLQRISEETGGNYIFLDQSALHLQ